MAAITEDQVKYCYDAARAVGTGTLGHSEAVQSVISTTGMNFASASDYVANIRLLIWPTGRIYARTMKIVETERILDWIVADYGVENGRKSAHEVLRHLDYYAQLPTGGNQPTLRATVERFLVKLPPTSLSTMAENEAVAVDLALASPKADRKARLAAANPRPRMTTVSVKVFLRNPDVVAEALDRANGRCEGCGQSAPFARFGDGRPFLEVHHRKSLADGGDDMPENTLALCPNCHREAHHGQHRARFLKLQLK